MRRLDIALSGDGALKTRLRTSAEASRDDPRQRTSVPGAHRAASPRTVPPNRTWAAPNHDFMLAPKNGTMEKSENSEKIEKEYFTRLFNQLGAFDLQEACSPPSRRSFDVNPPAGNPSAPLEGKKKARPPDRRKLEGVTTMRKQIGLFALAVVMGLGLTQSGFGQGPPAGVGPGQGPAMRGGGPGGPGGRGAGRGFNCPYRQATLATTAGTVAPGFGRGMGLRRNETLAPGTGPFCPFRTAAAGTAVGTSNTVPGFGPGIGMRRNAPVAPGTGPFCPFNPNNAATTGQAAGAGTQAGSATPATK